jgi:hypothetical protein
MNLEVVNFAANEGSLRAVRRNLTSCRILPTHLSECEFSMISCPSANCGQFEQRRNLDDHLRQCPYRLISCEICRLEIPSQDLHHHLGSLHLESLTKDEQLESEKKLMKGVMKDQVWCPCCHPLRTEIVILWEG